MKRTVNQQVILQAEWKVAPAALLPAVCECGTLTDRNWGGQIYVGDTTGHADDYSREVIQ
jgi:hypothetical protein